MKNIVDEFFIAIGLDMSDVDKGINKTVNTVKGGLSNLLQSVVAPALAGLASGALINQFTDEITQVDRLSKSLGMNIEQLSAWRTAAEMAGVEADEVGELFADLNDWMVDANNNQSGAMYDFIQQGLLPAVADANGQLKNTEQYAVELADALQKLGPQKASGIARQIGISNINMASFLQQGGGRLKAQLEAARKMGVYTQEDAKAAREFDASLNTVQRSMRMLLLPVFRAVVPFLTKFTDGAIRLTQNIDRLKPVIAAVAAALTGLLLPSIIKTTAAALSFFATPPGMLIAALGALLLLLDDLLVWMDGGKSALGEFWTKLFGDVETAKAWFAQLSAAIEKYGGYAPLFLKIVAVVAALNAVLSITSTIMTLMGVSAAATFGPIALAIMAVGAAILLVKMYWDEIVEAFYSAIDWIGSKIDWLQQKFGPLGVAILGIVGVIIIVRQRWDDLVAAFQAGIDWIMDKFSMVQEKLSKIKTLLPSFNFNFGAEQAVSPSTNNNSTVTNNNNTDVQGTVNINVNGNMDRDAVALAQEQSAAWFSVKQPDTAY